MAKKNEPLNCSCGFQIIVQESLDTDPPADYGFGMVRTGDSVGPARGAHVIVNGKHLGVYDQTDNSKENLKKNLQKQIDNVRKKQK